MADHSAHARKSESESRRPRRVRSYVLRGGRLTTGQKRALDELWPRFGVEAGDGPLEMAELFGNSNPVIAEIGFGDGAATWQMAAAHPEQNFLGVEVHRPGVGRLLLELEQRGLENVRVACADAVGFLERCVPPASLAGVRIYFPDPWPKKRHHKRRLIQDGFIALLASRMQPDAVLHLATDWAPYSEYMLAVMGRAAGFENLSPNGTTCSRPAWRPRTKYELRGKRLGHPVHDLVFRHVAHGQGG